MGKGKIHILLLIILIVIYFEPVVIFGVKFAYLYKILFIYLIVISILYQSKFRKSVVLSRKTYSLLIFLYLWSLSPVLFSVTREFVLDSIFIGGQRLFVAMVFHWLLVKNFSSKFLTKIYISFAVLTAISALPFVLGFLHPLGKEYDLSIINETSKGFVGIFQDAHAASFTLSLLGVGMISFALTSNKWAVQRWYILLSAIFVLLTIFTYARYGWISISIGGGWAFALSIKYNLFKRKVVGLMLLSIFFLISLRLLIGFWELK